VIALPDALAAAIRAEGETSYPDECCGVLLGEAGPAPDGAILRRVAQILPIDNAREPSEKYHRFRIEPEDYLRAEAAAEGRGLAIVGFYHSHPDHPARPSDYDRDHALPNWSYVVVAVGGIGRREPQAGDLTSWELSADRARFLPEHAPNQPEHDHDTRRS
jgi:proteasome lid subunit RPN8/RPN11